MLTQGIIRESNSPWAARAILVPKKSPDGKTKFRFCVDFRALNAVTNFDSYPLPDFEETTSTLHGSRYFSILDYYSGFWQINIEEQRSERDLQFRSVTTNSIGYHLVCPTAQQIFRG